jgi:hypothetical protein
MNLFLMRIFQIYVAFYSFRVVERFAHLACIMMLHMALISGCTSSQLTDPAGTATTKIGFNDRALAKLTEPLRQSDLERRFGTGEQQPGPRAVYRATDYPNMFYWVYFSERPDRQNNVRYIVLGDSIEENGRIVWPKRYIGTSRSMIPE